MKRLYVTEHLSLRTLATVTALACCAGQSAAADMSSGDVTSNLAIIQKSADEIVAGQYTTKAALQAPARSIALAWSKAEPVLAQRGTALVETKFANKSIAAFERDWQMPEKARSDAKDVSENVADLISAQKT